MDLRKTVEALSNISDSQLHHYGIDGVPFPSVPELREFVELCRAVLFPGYFGKSVVDGGVQYHIGVNLERIYEKIKKQIRYFSDREAMMDRAMAEYDRRSRTHRLCCRAGMLEKLLQDPELLTNSQVEELLKIAFAHEDVRQREREMLEEVEEHPETVQL